MEINRAYMVFRKLRELEMLEQTKRDLIYEYKISEMKTEKDIIRFLKFITDKGYKGLFYQCVNGVIDYLDKEIAETKEEIETL